MTSYQFAGFPEKAGFYEIGGPMGLQIYLAKRPCWLHRTATLAILGFVWKDAARAIAAGLPNPLRASSRT